MNLDNEIINTMLKKYIDKHYKIYKISPLFPISKKSPISFELFDFEQEKEIGEWSVTQYLQKIFSVGPVEVKRAMLELVNEEIERLKRQQIHIDYGI